MNEVDPLDAATDREIERGGRLVTRAPGHAVIRYGCGRVLMHLTFAALALGVNGLFVFPWIVWANTMRERRVTLRLDRDGSVVGR